MDIVARESVEHSVAGVMRPPAAAVCFAIPAALCLAASFTVNPGLLKAELLNPDSFMRLVRLRAILESGQALHQVVRDGSGQGTVLHWSHAFDSLLLMLSAPLALIYGWDRALALTALIVGPLGLGCLGLALAWAGLPVTRGQPLVWLGALATGLATPLLAYSYAGIVHHHVLLVVTAVMMTGWALRAGQRGTRAGVALGAWAGAGLWISPESLPFTLLAFGLAGLQWWSRRDNSQVSRALASAGLVFFVVTALACLADPPMNGIGAVEPDRLSIMYVSLAAGAACCGVLPILGAKRAWVAVAAVASSTLWLWTYPVVLHGTEGLMDAAQAKAFFGSITEMQPIKTAPQALAFLTGGALGCGFLILLARHHRSILLAYGAMCGGIILLMSWQHVRFSAYSAAFGAGVFPYMLDFLAHAPLTVPVRASARAALLLTVLGLPLAADLAEPGGTNEMDAEAACSMPQAVELLKDYPNEVVLAPVNATPELLRNTRVRTVGSLYHRNAAAFMRLRAAWLSVPGSVVSPEFDQAQISLVLVCPLRSAKRSLGVTMQDRLAEGRPPDWLQKAGDTGGYVLYRVVRPIKPTSP